jgi:ArsR family transcriptional regulator
MMSDSSKQDQFRAQARIIKALSHPTRLMIVDELSRGERCVCDLTALAGTEMSTVSRHLSMLKEVGILQDEKRGTQVFYRLRVPCVLNFLRCVLSVQENPADLARDLAECAFLHEPQCPCRNK